MRQEIQSNWKSIKEAVRLECGLTDVSYNTWIAPLTIYEITDEEVVILIPSAQRHVINYISNKFTAFFHVIIEEMFGYTYEIRFLLESDVPLQFHQKGRQESNSIRSIAEEANLNPKYKYDNFVVGSSNKFAHSASLAVAESPGQIYNPLYLYGGPGLGKTHLMHAIGHFILEDDPTKKILYVTSEDFTNEVIDSIRNGDATALPKLREKYRTVDVLMIDDVQFIIGKESTQQEFFHTFNGLHAAGKQIILSSDKPPKDMEVLDGRFRSRFEWGLIADVQTPDYETRMAILKKNLERSGKCLEEEILKYIATNFQYNIRELEGALNKIFAYSKLHKVEMTLAYAQDALKDIIANENPPEVTPALILHVVAEHFSVKPEHIISTTRRSEIILPRHIVMYLCRELIGTSYSNIGDILGKRDHSTVMHGIKRIKQELGTDTEIKRQVEIIQKKLT